MRRFAFIMIFLTAALCVYAAQNVKTVNGLAIASVKTINQLAIASVKDVNGLDNTSSGGLPLDSYTTNLQVAYSVARRLNTSYTGSLFRVKRSSDSTEQDIGYGGDNWWDDSALSSFVGANNGDVVKIYDQSGGGYNLNYITVGMRCVASGTNITLAGKLAVKQVGGVGSAGYYSDTFTSYTGTTLTCFARGQIPYAAYNRYIGVTSGTGGDTATGAAAFIICAGSGTAFATYTAAGEKANTISPTTNTDQLVSAIADGTNLKLRDGTNTGSAAHSAAWSINRVISAATSSSAAYGAANAYYSEIILWTSDQTSNEAAIRSALTY